MIPGMVAHLGVLLISFPGAESTALMVLRWIHLVVGLTWIGLLYFFVLVNTPFLQELDWNLRVVVFPKLMSRAMWWFRWSSVLTVLVGLAYWMHIVATDARNAKALGIMASSGRMFGTFFLLWTLAFFIEMAALMSPVETLKKGPILGILVTAAVVAASWLFLTWNQTGWESNRDLTIGIGGGLGWFMMFNVWGIVWRVQKKLIRWTEANGNTGAQLPPELVKLSQISLSAARVSFWLSFPMLFFMGAASHCILFIGR